LLADSSVVEADDLGLVEADVVFELDCEAVADPVADPVAEPVAEPVADPVAEPVPTEQSTPV